jgi:hypothetical protein
MPDLEEVHQILPTDEFLHQSGLVAPARRPFSQLAII